MKRFSFICVMLVALLCLFGCSGTPGTSGETDKPSASVDKELAEKVMEAVMKIAEDPQYWNVAEKDDYPYTCTKDYADENGVTILKGSTESLNSASIVFDLSIEYEEQRYEAILEAVGDSVNVSIDGNEYILPLA